MKPALLPHATVGRLFGLIGLFCAFASQRADIFVGVARAFLRERGIGGGSQAADQKRKTKLAHIAS